jgi:hypothetical protein
LVDKLSRKSSHLVIKTEYLLHEDNIHIAHRVMALLCMQTLAGGIKGPYFIIGNKKVDRA